MEKSHARETVTIDLSTPWLRHCGRDDSVWLATAVEMTVFGCATAVEMNCVESQLRHSTPSSFVASDIPQRPVGSIC